MRSAVIIFLALLCPGLIHSQSPTVPDQLDFADLKLKINEKARKEIQADVDALTQSTKYFEVKVQKARQYFPIIERILKEEGAPDDFKYLVLQESALIADAVSTSNAVGFWQFKTEAASEVDLRMDRNVDERMNIVSSTRGAAKYLQKNNYFFNNWLYALQAYQMGAGAAQKVLDPKKNGARKMQITGDTYWYVKKYLAHKIAFEHALQKQGTLAGSFVEHTENQGKTLKEISRELGVDHSALREYNKWIKRGRIPDDKTYTVIVPSSQVTEAFLAGTAIESNQNDFDQGDRVNYPSIEPMELEAAPFLIRINGIDGIVARKGDVVKTLARAGGISADDFRRYNDLRLGARLIEGQVYYLKKKRTKAIAYYHTTQRGENLWGISQKYGVKLKKIRKMNRMKPGDKVAAGRVLWLRKTRPNSIPVEFRQITPQESQPLTSRESPPQTPEEIKPESITTNDNPEPEPAGSTGLTKEVKEPEVSQTQKERERIPAEDPAPIMHTVVKGETFYSISRKYSISVEELLDWNKLSLEDGLSIGQSVTVYRTNTLSEPVERPENDLFLTHNVSQGETLYGIAGKYGVSVEELMKLNNKHDQNLSAGEKLRIKPKK